MNLMLQGECSTLSAIYFGVFCFVFLLSLVEVASTPQEAE